ncbi:bacterio-opsin activator domain-containing protein [Halogeometricum limi]|uniref:PAS domain S-box-containing protein n=1 Tax=Halogeometricum limi TaxID=555875 RepID=A0A1I6IJ52_9EURY|nr:bacterio-opsin activator domain-containing protein [Halogeometricum limi]SFR66746.1 PAS domain S-box-containing protein [Halogeometricum limi]
MATSVPDGGAQFYEAVLEGSMDGFVVVNGDGVVVFVNPALELFLGHAPKSLLGRPVESFVSGDEVGFVVPPDDETGQRGERTPNRTVELVDADGRTVTVSSVVEYLTHEDAPFTACRFSLDGSDVDGERTYYAPLFEDAADPILQYSHRESTATVRAVNEAFDVAFGELGDVTGRAVFDVLAEVGAHEDVREDGTGLRPDETRLETTVRRATAGETRAYAVRSIPVERTGWHGGFVVFTEADAEAGVETTHWESTALETTLAGIAVLDADGRFAEVNRATVEMYGFDRSDALVGESWLSFYDEREAQRLETAAVPRVDETGQWAGETVARRADGTAFYQELTLTRLDDGGMFWIAQDISALEATVERLEALTQASRRLMAAETTDEIARATVETVEDVLGFDVACVRLFDPERHTFEIADSTPEARRLVETYPGFDLDASNAGRAFRNEETVRVTVDEVGLLAESTALHVPLPEYGALTVYELAAAEDEVISNHLHLLATNVCTALERTIREAELCRHEREIQSQHSELDTLNRINTLLFELTPRLMTTTTRSEVYQTVCEELAASEFYESAWVGAVTTIDGQLELLAEAGLDEGYRRSLETLPVTYVAQGTVAEAVQTKALHIARRYRDDPDEQSGTPGTRTVEAVAAVPLVRGEQIYGVLVLAASRDDVFTESIQRHLEMLGEAVGFVVGSILNSELLLSDRILELEFQTAFEDCLPVAFSKELGCRCEFEMFVPLETDRCLVYLQMSGADPEEALAVAASIDNVDDCRVVNEYDDEFLLELTAEKTIIETLMRVGAAVPSMVAEDGTARITVETSPKADVRSITETLRGQFPDAQLVTKREVSRQVRTAAELREGLKDTLTDKQLLAIETAHVAGFYNWPRGTSAKELAASLGVSAPTLHQHLRKAEQKLVEAFFAERDRHAAE